MNTPERPDDGGPAFPPPSLYASEDVVSTGCTEAGVQGVSLRDYFAAKAMIGLLGTAVRDRDGRMPFLFWSHEHGLGWNSSGIPRDLSALAYAMADAMLAERDGKGGAS